jgi:tetratricopeptide (TPR) repeat protein
MPVTLGLQACAVIRAENPGRLADAFVLEQESILWAMHGDLDRAFSSNATATATYRNIGLTLTVAASTLVTGQIYLLADDPASAERTLAEGENLLLAVGAAGIGSTVEAVRAEALCRLGKYEAALEATRSSEAAAGPDDVESQVRWRAVRGKCLARLGDPRQGEVLCREAVTMIKKTDWLSIHADTVASLGEVLRLDGRDSEAAVAFQESLELYERKGNRTYARKIRVLLEQRRS